MSARTSRVETEIEAIGAAKAAAAAPAAAAAVKSQGNSVDPPLLQQCLRSGCIQEKKAELSTSIYLISLLRVVSLLKAPRPAEIGRTGPRGFYYTLVQEEGGEGGAGDGGGESGGGASEGGGGGGGGGEGAATRRIRYVAAAGWIIFFVIAAACQFFLYVLILETSTSRTCDVKSQIGLRGVDWRGDDALRSCAESFLAPRGRKRAGKGGDEWEWCGRWAVGCVWGVCGAGRADIFDSGRREEGERYRCMCAVVLPRVLYSRAATVWSCAHIAIVYLYIGIKTKGTFAKQKVSFSRF